MCKPQTYLAVAALLATAFTAGSAGAQTSAVSGSDAFDQTVSAALSSDAFLPSIANQKVTAQAETEELQAGAAHGGGGGGRPSGGGGGERPGGGGDRPNPGPRPGPVDPGPRPGPVNPGPRPEPPAPRPGPVNPGPRPGPVNPGPRPGPNPGEGHGGDWSRWPGHPAWGDHFNRWNWVGLDPHWWGWALWTGGADHAACYNWYGGELSNCNNSCAAENDSCVAACSGDADCYNQCNAQAGYCTSTCQGDYNLDVANCPF
jgi:hypothetical protein